MDGCFITGAPVLMEIFKWAEKMNLTPITNEIFNYAVSRKLEADSGTGGGPQRTDVGILGGRGPGFGAGDVYAR